MRRVIRNLRLKYLDERPHHEERNKIEQKPESSPENNLKVEANFQIYEGLPESIQYFPHFFIKKEEEPNLWSFDFAKLLFPYFLYDFRWLKMFSLNLDRSRIKFDLILIFTFWWLIFVVYCMTGNINLLKWETNF